MARIAFFIGKGGVGKTTLASAHAVRSATRQRGESVLLISTDPAHSLADIFEIKLGDVPRPVPISVSRKLLVWQIDASKQFRKFLDRHREAILDLVESGTIFSRREIEPLLDATLPGMAEFAATLALRDLVVSGRYAEIVVDTAPLGHTLRLFEMPGHFARFLEFLDLAASRDRVLAERFGGAAPPSQPLVAEWRTIESDVQEAFSGKDARVTLVTTPETFALNESMRAAEALRRSASPMAINSIILNRVVTSASACPRCRARVRDTRAARVFLARHFRGLTVLEALPCAGLVCWASRVSRVEFADRLAENMENLEWLAAASVRHQRVVGEVAARTTILPARFGTVFLSEASLEAHVRKHKRSLLAAFRRITDADEWGVKVFSVTPPSSSVALRAASGTEYLQRKAAALETARGALDPDVRSFAQALRRIAQASAAGGKVSGGQRDLEWQASFLLRRSRQKQWRAVLDRFAARWQKSRRIECTGPWPPYSFVSTDGG